MENNDGLLPLLPPLPRSPAPLPGPNMLLAPAYTASGGRAIMTPLPLLPLALALLLVLRVPIL
jgi:hypothetical protein